MVKQPETCWHQNSQREWVYLTITFMLSFQCTIHSATVWLGGTTYVNLNPISNPQCINNDSDMISTSSAWTEPSFASYTQLPSLAKINIKLAKLAHSWQFSVCVLSNCAQIVMASQSYKLLLLTGAAVLISHCAILVHCQGTHSLVANCND